MTFYSCVDLFHEVLHGFPWCPVKLAEVRQGAAILPKLSVEPSHHIIGKEQELRPVIAGIQPIELVQRGEKVCIEPANGGFHNICIQALATDPGMGWVMSCT